MGEECISLNNPLFILSFIRDVSVNQDRYNELQEKFKTCKINLNSEWISKINAFKQGKLDELGFIQLMKSYKIPKDEINKVQDMIQVWKESKKTAISLDDWIVFFNLYAEEMPKEKKYMKIKEFLNKRNTEKNEGLLAMDDFILSLNSENYAWIKRASKKMLTFHPLSFRYYIQRNKKSEEKVKNFLDLFNKYLISNEKKFDDPLLRLMIQNQINSIFFVPMGAQMEMVKSLSLADLRQNSSSHIWGEAYFDFWFNQFLGRTSFEESQDILAKNLTTQMLSSLDSWRLWVLLFNIKGETSWRKVMTQKLGELSKLKDPLSQEILISLLRDSTIKLELSKVNTDYSFPLFRLERQHYRECLKNRPLFNYCLSRLMELGDIDNTVIWYYVLDQVGVL